MLLKLTLLCYEGRESSSAFSIIVHPHYMRTPCAHTHTRARARPTEKFTVQTRCQEPRRKIQNNLLLFFFYFFLFLKKSKSNCQLSEGLFHHGWLPNFPTVIHPKKLMVKPFKTIYANKHQAQLFVLAPLCSKPDWTKTRWGRAFSPSPCGATLGAAQQTRWKQSTAACNGECFNI